MTIHVRRREFLTLLGGAAAAWPLAARAAAGDAAGGVSSPWSAHRIARPLDCVPQGLKEIAYVEGENIVIESGEKA
jgi:putative ABC transport system substrate-binding protein